jgi:hypothetical protein
VVEVEHQLLGELEEYHLAQQLPTALLEPMARVVLVDQPQHLVQLLPAVEAVEADTSAVAVEVLTPIQLALMVEVVAVALAT